MQELWKHAATVAVALTLTAVSAHADPALFSPLDAASYAKALSLDPSFQALVDDPTTGDLYLARAHAAAVTDKTATLTLDLAPGVALRAHLVEAYRTGSGSLVWSGIVEDPGAVTTPFSAEALQLDPIHSVTLVRNGDQITGNVHVGGDWYKIRPLAQGGHAVVRVDLARMPPDHPAEYASLPTFRLPVRAEDAAASGKTDSVIRVLVSYTPAAAASSGDVRGLIDLAIAESNEGYANSGIAITLQLAAVAPVDYRESGSFDADLKRFRELRDGFMDDIHALRDASRADVGILLLHNGSACGLASAIRANPANAFAAVSAECATGYYSFAHEIGHLQGARHNAGTDPSKRPYAYGHGFQYNGSPSWRTIMAYNCWGGCPRLNYWSNPNRLYNGSPMGTSALSDNARVLNGTRAAVARFRK